MAETNFNALQADAPAIDTLFAQLYEELAAMARARLRRGQRLTLADTGALVHESWLRLKRSGKSGFDSEGHFLAHAARVMRSVMVDLARRSQAERRGGHAEFVTLSTDAQAELGDLAAGSLVQLSEALEQLAAIDARLASVVEMRFFAGLSEPEIAAALNVAERTVRRDWEKARAFLSVALKH
jgi:RNA polymerase sigma factor (TIGR02999 family)